MAIYHLYAQVISRGKGQSAIAAAAYRSGERLRDEQADEQKFYGMRAERIVFTDILAPKDAPEWAHDRNRLWNEAEGAEKRKDGQLAREFEISLPHELSDQQRQWLIKDFAREAFVRHGYAVDIAIHAPDKHSDDRNHHAHLMVTMRRLGPEGFTGNKDRSLNTGDQLDAWRAQWAHLANRHLERHGHAERIDHRSLKMQGIDREATVHVGYAAGEMAQRGAQSDRMDNMREILARNEIRIDLSALDKELKGLEQEKAAEDSKAAQRQQDEAARAADAARAAAAAKSLQDKQSQADKVADRVGGDRQAAELALQRLAGLDEQARRDPAAQAFAKDIRAEAKEIRRDVRQEGREAAFWEQQEAAQAKTHPRAPDAGKAAERGLQVVDGATGAVSKLGDFVVDLLAGSPARPEPSKADMRAFVTDPAARKEQQLARLGRAREQETAEKAIERIREDMQAGRNLKAEDIRGLTRQHQEQIRTFGDSAVQQMVDAARKRDEQYWKGQERERDR